MKTARHPLPQMGLDLGDKAPGRGNESSGTIFVVPKVQRSQERQEIDRVLFERRVTYRKDLAEFYKVIEGPCETSSSDDHKCPFRQQVSPEAFQLITSCVDILGLMTVPLLLLAIAMGSPQLALAAVVLAAICF